MLTIAYDDIELADDGSTVRARPNCPMPPGRFQAGWLLRLALLRPDRLQLARTEDVVRAGRPFVYPLELTRDALANFSAAPALATGIPTAVLESARRGRAVILVWLGHEAVPLELNEAGTVWLYDVIELLIMQNALPRGALCLVTGTVSALDGFVEWLHARGLFLPEAPQLHALTVFPTYAQACYRANRSGWDVACAVDGADGAARASKTPLPHDAFRERYVAADEIPAERASGRVRDKGMLCLADGLELHRQLIVTNLHANGHIADSLIAFGAAPPELNDTCAFPVPGMTSLQEALRANWLELQCKLPLIVDGPSPYRRSYLSIASEASFAGHPLIDQRLLTPILNRQPFIFAGSPGTLQYLRALGFKTFGGVIDESYDKADVFSARMLRMLRQIEAVGRSKTALRELYFACLPELEHNHAHLIEGRHQLEAMLRELDQRLGTD